MPTAPSRLEVRLPAESKSLIERAAALRDQSVTAFVLEAVVARATEVVHGRTGAPSADARPIGGWNFALPPGWDDPLDDLAEYR
jgi:hypothetical protein